MKRILAIVLLCCIGLMLNVSAAGVQTLDAHCTVDSSGGCQVNLSGILHLEDTSAPVIPIPEEATDITLNGQKAPVTTQDGLKQVRLEGAVAGPFSFRLGYRLPMTVAVEKESMMLELPLLSGFAWPVESFSFTVQLPGQITEEPVFTSSYYQELIASQLQLSVSGNTLTGTTGALKDHETLSMELPVTDAMFPQTAATARVMGVMDVVVLAAFALAVLYYILTMRPHFFRRERRATAPDGISAGDLQLWLTGQGIDLSLMVVTWAQLGYLRIQVEDSGRVLLHKRMDMGNERSVFENRCFKRLFGQRCILEGTGRHYAQLLRELNGQTPGIRDVYKPRSGNPKLFKLLCILAGGLSGVNIGAGLMPNAPVFSVFMALATAVASALVFSGGCAMPRRQKRPLAIAGGCSLVWLLLGIFSGEFAGTLIMILLQFLSGVAAAYGGRRSMLGRQAMEEILGLRRHLLWVPYPELKQLLKGNSGYFYEMAPYALALDADRIFARRFGRLRLQECSYLMTGNRRQMTAYEWAKLLRTTVEKLDAGAKQLPMDQFLRKSSHKK